MLTFPPLDCHATARTFLFRSGKGLLLFLLFFQTGCFSKTHQPPKELISAADLKEDFDVLRKTLEEAHPGLYWYSGKAATDDYFDSSKAAINYDMTGEDFFKFLLPLIANIKCVHTNIQLPAGAFAGQFKHLLPFDFYCQKGKLYIQKALNGDGHAGAEVLSINNIKATDILRTLLGTLPTDGYNESHKYHLLNKGAFREGYALFFGQPERFAMQVTDSNRQTSSFYAAAILPRQIAFVPATLTPAFELDFRQNTAVLSVNTFEMSRTQFGDSLSKTFQAIRRKGSKRLIIDLRQNGGGTNDNVSQLYAYIAATPFLHLKKAEMPTTALTYPQFVGNKKSLDFFSKKLEGTGVYSVNDLYAGTKEHKPVSENLFTGDVVLLTDGNTTSAASEFAAMAHFLKRAKIAGEETGGCYYGASGGNYLNLRLPHSGCTVRIPTIRILTAVDEDFVNQPKGRGTLPDYPVMPTIKDVINKRDVQLEAALKISAD